jgi:hypothetical protein
MITFICISAITLFDWAFGSLIVAAMRERFEQRFNDWYQLLYGMIVAGCIFGLWFFNFHTTAWKTALFFLCFCEDLAYWLLLAAWNPFNRTGPSHIDILQYRSLLEQAPVTKDIFPRYISSYIGWLGRRFGYIVRIETRTAAFIALAGLTLILYV